MNMVVKRDFLYTPKGKNRMLHIYLPQGYEDSTESYPVMFFFDGHNLFADSDATYGKSWGLKEFLDNWDKDIILVGIECGHEGDERLSEYLPYKPGFGFVPGAYPMGKETMDWIVNEIKPMVDREYRTLPQREHTGIGGSSMGGLMSLYAILCYNSWFSKAACVSTAMSFCFRRVLTDLRSRCLEPDTKVYLSWGTREAIGLLDKTRADRTSLTYHQNQKAANLLHRSGADVKLVCQVNGRHCEADWEKQNPRFMNFLWK
jgi:predicted alpha/beta superfamily hydrolase